MIKFSQKAHIKRLLIFFLIFSWIFSVWVPIWQLNNNQWSFGLRGVLAENNKVSRDQLKAKYDASQLPSKYDIQGTSLQKTIKTDKREKTELRIGNENSVSFEPVFEFRKWDEVSLKLIPRLSTVAQEDKNIELIGDKIKYKTPKDEIDFYELPESSTLPEGGYEIERILNEKPDSNVIIFDMQADNLDFFYQPIYSDEEIAALASEGDFVNPDAMGSYVVYYKNVPLNYTNKKLYKTGKVGQIYRPKIDDAAGNWTWGDLNVDIVNNKLTITIPQDFLDKATYPIYHASGLKFGYETIGTGGSVTIENNIRCTINTMGTNAGTVDTMTIYSSPSQTTATLNSGIYLHSTLALVTNATSPTLTPAGTGAGWRTTTYVSKPSLSGSTGYLLCTDGLNSSATHVVYYDISGDTTVSHAQANTFPTYTNPLVPTHSSRLFSIYATYTPVPDAPTNVAATDGSATDKVTVTWTKSTGATGYRVYRDSVDVSGLLGDVATYDDTGATAGTITAGTASATDGTANDKVTLSISGETTGTTNHTYYVVAVNAAGNSANSSTNVGYRGVGSITYLWYRSSGTGDSSFSSLGATTDPYDDTTAPAGTITAGTASATDGTANDKVTLSVSGESTTAGAVRYYYATLSATGAASVDTNHNAGNRGVGSITYLWYRSSGTGDSSFSSLGATTDPYDDTTAPAGTITAGTASATDGTANDKVTLSVSGESTTAGAVRYYYATLSATGAASVDTNHNAGNRGVGSITYLWYRSSGTGDSSFSSLGATTDPYDDTTAPAGTITAGTAAATDGTISTHVALSLSGQSTTVGAARYYYATLSANGAAGSQDTTHNDGYRGIGSLTYQWQRSAADSNASYSNIDGATTASYNDTGAPADGSGRYFQCVESANGASPQTSAADRGYRGIISITVTANGTINYGVLAAGANKSTLQLGTTPVVQNSGTVAEDFYIQGSDTACPWTLTGTAGNGTYKHEYSSDGGSNWTSLTKVGDQVLVSNIAASATQNIDLRVTVPTVSACYTSQNAGIVITAFEY